MRLILAIAIVLSCVPVYGQECFNSSVVAPSPLMGNHGEIFRTSDGAIYQVTGSYEYLYAYYPSVSICPSRGKMLVEGRTVGIKLIKASVRSEEPSGKKSPNKPRQRETSSSEAPITIVLRVQGCSYFIADGPRGLYVLEWYGGYDPDHGDGIFGDISGYGFKDVLYTGGHDGRVYVDDYLLGKDRALEKLKEKCR